MFFLSVSCCLLLAAEYDELLGGGDAVGAIQTRGFLTMFGIWSIDVLVDHAPMTAAVGLGTLVINLPSGEKKISTLFDGYAVVQENTAVIIAEAAEWPDEIDAERAEAAKERAEKRLKQSDIDFARAQNALLRSISRLELYKLRK